MHLLHAVDHARLHRLHVLLERLLPLGDAALLGELLERLEHVARPLTLEAVPREDRLERRVGREALDGQSALRAERWPVERARVRDDVLDRGLRVGDARGAYHDGLLEELLGGGIGEVAKQRVVDVEGEGGGVLEQA